MSGYFDYCIPRLASNDLAMLERVLVRFCVQEDVPLSSFVASDAATALVVLYEHGCHSERQLGKILRLNTSNSNEPKGTAMMAHHRIALGSLVRLVGQTPQILQGEVYRVLAWMPESEGSPQYRIRSDAGWSRLAKERDLRIVPSGRERHQSLPGSRRRQQPLEGDSIAHVFPRYKGLPH